MFHVLICLQNIRKFRVHARKLILLAEASYYCIIKIVNVYKITHINQGIFININIGGEQCLKMTRKRKGWKNYMRNCVLTVSISVEIQVIRQEDFMYMLKCIAELDETSRLVLLMKYVQGLSYKEIGKALGMTAKHVDTRIMRAKQKVRKLIEMRGMNEMREMKEIR